MDLSTLQALYPVVMDLIQKVPRLVPWFKERAEKEDPLLFLQLQNLQAISSLGQAIGDLRSYTLTTAIMSAMLSNPKLKPEDIKAKFIMSGEVAKDILSTIKQVAP